MNGDGRIDETDLRHILQSAYPSITDLNVNCLFNQVDAKRRGSVTYGECRATSQVLLVRCCFSWVTEQMIVRVLIVPL